MSNTLTIVGNLGGDPELRFTPNGDAVCNVSIADTPRRQNQAGEWEDAGETLWVRAAVWREKGEALANTAKRGDKVIATGRLTVRTYERQDGTQGQAFELQHAEVAVVSRPEYRDSGNGGQQARQPVQQQQQPAARQSRQQPAPQPRPEPQQQSWQQDFYDEPPF